MTLYGVARKGKDFAVVTGESLEELKGKCRPMQAELTSHTSKERSARRAVAAQARAFKGEVLPDDFGPQD